MQHRNKALDITKGLGIILVMVGHINMPSWIINVIYFFHMPLFLLISGYLHKKKGFMETLKSITPYCLSYLFYGLLFIFISFLLSGQISSGNLNSLILFQPGSIWGIRWFGVFWFIIMMLMIKLIASIVPFNKNSTIVFLLFFFLGWFFTRKFSILIDLPFALLQSFSLFIFYVIGYYSKNFERRVKYWHFIFFGILFILAAGIALIYTNGFIGKIVNYHLLKFFNPVYALVLALSGSIAFYGLARSISKFDNYISQVLSYMGNYSFAFFALHLFCFFLLKKILSYLVGISVFIELVVIIPLTIVIVYNLCFLINRFRWLPGSYKKIILLK
jgi:fucose 4-O-acetylase-like acetyltransferase